MKIYYREMTIKIRFASLRKAEIDFLDNFDANELAENLMEDYEVDTIIEVLNNEQSESDI